MNKLKKFAKMKVPSILLIFVLLLPCVIPANILFFFGGGNVSHKISVWPWVLELAKRGHNVTFISPHSKTPVPHPNITDNVIQALTNEVNKVYQVDRFKDRDTGADMDFEYNQVSAQACHALVNAKETEPTVAALFDDSQFDLVVVNSIFGECGYYVGHYFGAKMITYDSCTFITWFYDTYGVSPETGWVPDLIFKFRTIPMDFWERTRATWLAYYWMYARESLSPMLQNAAQPLSHKEPESLPSLYELETQVSVVFINSHPSVDFARTLPPLFVDIGGVASSATLKEMPQNFKEFMDRSGSSGVVLISFDSTVLLNTVSTRFQAMFFHLIHEFPNVRFMMRWSGPLPKFLDKPSKNLLVSDWLPQKEILSHPKLKLFITHGGVSSIHEATYYGVPLIVVPLFADQDYNAYRIEAQEVGTMVEIRGMTEETLVNAVDKVLKNDKYKTNMLKKQAIFRDRPMSPVDTAVFWTEFALRHNDTLSTFRPMNQHLNSFHRRLLDIYLFSLGVILVALVVIAYVLKFTFKMIFYVIRNNERKSAKKVD